MIRNPNIIPRHARWAVRLNSTFQKPLFRIFIGPLMLGLPPVLVMTYFSISRVEQSINNYLPSLSKFFNDDTNILIVVISSIAWTYFLYLLHALVVTLAQGKEPISSDRAMKLLKILETVVERKTARFAKYIKQMDDNCANLNEGDNTFNSITQPDQQLGLLMEALLLYFESLFPDIGIRIGLARIVNDQPIDDWEFWAPQRRPPRTQLSQLRDSRSTLAQCLKTSKIVIVEDIHDPKKVKFLETRDLSSEEGSLICYPIPYSFGRPQTAYVICVVGETKRCFRKGDRILYEWIFEQFVPRIQLEHCLTLIKERKNS